jgi:energy-coupling factor transporter transmembrane protein EcfT
VLFVRTLEQAERTHQAMIARGYDGTIRLGQPLRWHALDTVFAVAAALYLVALRAPIAWF